MSNSKKKKKNRKYKYLRGHFLNAIVMIKENNSDRGAGPYHKIKHTDEHVERFLTAMKRLHPNATHVNFYHSIDKKFLFQKRFVQPGCVHPTKQDNVMIHKRKRCERSFNNAYSITGYDYQLNELIFNQW